MNTITSTLRNWCSPLIALCGLACGAASAQDNVLSFISEPGDWVGQGQTRSFTEGIYAQATPDNRYIRIYAYPSGQHYTLNLQAPEGRQLTAGVYENPGSYPFQGPTEYGMSFLSAYGCSRYTGRFEVVEARYGPLGYIETFRANFEQHCDGASPGLFGEVIIRNPPPPPMLAITLTLDSKGYISPETGLMSIGGEIRCTVPTSVYLAGSFTSRVGRGKRPSYYSATVPCGTTTTRWSASEPEAQTGAQPGAAETELLAYGLDPNYSQRPVFADPIQTVITLHCSGQDCGQ